MLKIFYKFRYAWLCLVVWSIYLAAFWPGLMSPDSISQWEQVLLKSISNNYPAFHTLTNWLVTRFWYSPAAIAIIQMVSLAVVFSYVLCELEFWGVSKRVCSLIAVMFSMSPVNGMLVITLWKDIPFTAAMLALFAILLRTVRTDGNWLLTLNGMGTLWGALLLISLFRHNGVPIVVASLIVLLLVWRKQCGRTIVRIGINWLLVFIIITGPIFRLIGIWPMATFFAYQNLLHQIGALVHNGAIEAQRDIDFLVNMQPIETWTRQYHCHSLNPLIYNEEFKHGFLEQSAKPLLGIWWRGVRQNPELLLRHQLCVTELLWRITEPVDKEGRLYITENGIVPNHLGLRTDSLWPQARAFLNRLVKRTSEPDLVWIVWRPAFYLYILFLLIGLATLRLKNCKMLLVGIPAVLNTTVWSLIITTQDLRFQYPVYVMAMIAPALMFAKRIPRGN